MPRPPPRRCSIDARPKWLKNLADLVSEPESEGESATDIDNANRNTVTSTDSTAPMIIVMVANVKQSE